MLKPYAFYVGSFLLWGFGLVLIGEIALAIQRNTDVFSTDEDTVVGAAAVLYIGSTLFIYGVV